TRWNSWTDGESPDGKRTRSMSPGVPADPPGSAGAPGDVVPLLPLPPGPRAADGGEAMDPGTTQDAARITPAEIAALRRALEIAAAPGVPPVPRPRVSSVPIGADGTVLAEAPQRGAGAANAEADAIARAREPPGAPAAPRGATAVVTLEPCDHTGR